MRKTAVLLFSVSLLAQTPALTVDFVMRGPALVGYEPSQARWSGDGAQVYFQWKTANQKDDAPMDTYVVNRDGSGLRKLSDDEAKLAPPAGGDVSKDRRSTVYANSGDLFVYDHVTGKVRQITKTGDVESNPHFLAGDKRISFTRAGNLYVLSLEDGSLSQLTDIRSDAAPAPAAPTAGGRGGRGGGAAPVAAGQPPRGTDSQEWLKKEQKDLLEIIRERAARREEEEARRKKENPRKPFTLPARQSVTTMTLSPDEKFVVATVSEGATGVRNTIVPNYVTESAYAEDIPGRANVGDTQPRTRLALIDVATGDVKYVDHGQKITPPNPANQRTEGGRGAAAPQPQDRDIQLLQPVWSEDGKKAVIAARAADTKDRWLLALDPATGKTRVLVHDHDDAWVGGPGTAVGWLKNDREVYFQSERSGWPHVYAVSFEGGEPRALTSGKWEVKSVTQAPDKSHLYITASKESLYDQDLYDMPGDGGPMARLTNTPGKHDAVVSPDGKSIADIYSYTNKPPELYVDGKRVTTSPAPEFDQHAWLDAPIVTFTARDGVKVPARLFKPANQRRGGPGVVFVHGAGYLQNVDHKWSSYYREYLFHHLLRERGFTVIDVDYRGSAGYGRDWRTAIYEHMGGKDLDDIVDAAKYLVSDHGVDPKKIGLYGGSYGGFITLMAMFTQPDVFAAGAALRPVTDWAHYNHPYTSSILNLPQTDPEAYRKSSPIYFAQGLKGALLICHGMVDTNVEFIDSVRLAQRLIELRKENWELAPYPVENHAFVQASSWADEYKRILKLFETNLK
jgi:dipeptidyl aminopeptidase/acylaminoacyl peptidase